MAKTPTNKRKSTSIQKQKVTIEVEDVDPASNPIVVSFPGGVPDSLQGNSTGAMGPKFSLEKLHEKSKFGRRVVGEDKHCTYSAHSQGLGYDDRRTKLCIGVYDKKKGVVVIREAASRGTVYALEQSVPAYLEKNGEVQEIPGQGMLQYNTALFEDFGSSKKRKVLKSQAANRVEIDHVVGAGDGSAVMHQVMAGSSMSESNRKAIEESKQEGENGKTAVDAALEAARRDFLPKYDVDAVKPDKVYNAREIAGEAAWKRVYNKVHACMHKDDVEGAILESIFENDWFECSRKIVKEISPESNSAGHRYTCAILLNWIVKFYTGNHNRRQIPTPNETKATYFGIPIEVASRWVALFTTSFTDDRGKLNHAMSKSNKDKCIVHALILYMMAQGSSMKIANLKPIAQDMKVTVNDCCSILRLAGCTVSKKGSSYGAVLKTPLTFPPPPRGGGGGRRGR